MSKKPKIAKKIKQQVTIEERTVEDCTPTSGVVCTYCKKRGICNHVLPRTDISLKKTGAYKEDVKLRRIDFELGE